LARKTTVKRKPGAKPAARPASKAGAGAAKPLQKKPATPIAGDKRKPAAAPQAKSKPEPASKGKPERPSKGAAAGSLQSKLASGNGSTAKGAAAPGKKGASATPPPPTSSRRAPKTSSKNGEKTPAGESGAGGKGGKRRSVVQAASQVVADANGYVTINGRRVRMISTKGQSPAKKPRVAAPPPAPRQPEAEDIKAIKTKLDRKELNHYRELLLLKRRQLVGDLSAMEEEALRSGGGNLSHMPIHMADIGTDTYDQDFMLGMAENERQHVRDIDQALKRIEEKTYGVCQMTGKPIPKARLDAKPWAKYTIEAARLLESRGIRV